MLALQRDINFEDVGVILVNDGEGNEIPEEHFTAYPYKVKQISIPKGGVSKARNAGLDASTADWVMFCDFDDCFSSLFGLHLIFCGIAEDKYDLLRAVFTEETRDDDGMIHLVSHDDDTVFIHGKVMRRKFLLENGIRFHPKLTIHEDGFFNVLTYSLAKDRGQKINTPIYIWAWNDNSVVRKDRRSDFVLDTYEHLMRQRIALTEEYIKRQMPEETVLTVVKTVLDAYYDFQQHEWRTLKNKAKVEKAERWFCAYLKRYGAFYQKAELSQIAKLAAIPRGRVLMTNRMYMEGETLGDFILRMINKVRPIPVEEQDV